MNDQQLTDQQLDEYEKIANAASPGPWCTDGAEVYQGDEYLPGLSEWIGETCRADEGDGGKADAAFVAAARTAVPALLTKVRRLRAELARHVQCNDCGAVGEVYTGTDGLAYLDPSGQIGHHAVRPVPAASEEQQ